MPEVTAANIAQTIAPVTAPTTPGAVAEGDVFTKLDSTLGKIERIIGSAERIISLRARSKDLLTQTLGAPDAMEQAATTQSIGTMTDMLIPEAIESRKPGAPVLTTQPQPTAQPVAQPIATSATGTPAINTSGFVSWFDRSMEEMRKTFAPDGMGAKMGDMTLREFTGEYYAGNKQLVQALVLEQMEKELGNIITVKA